MDQTEEEPLNYSTVLDLHGFENHTRTPLTILELPIEMTFNSGHILSIIVYSILFVFSSIGNLTVFSILLRRRLVQSRLSPIDYMLLHLAVADLMVTFLMMPLELGWAFTVDWRGGDFLCRVMAFFRIFGLFQSSFVLVCLAIDRYLAIKHPMHVLAGIQRSRKMISIAWAMSVICSSPQVYIFHVERHPDFPWYQQCVVFSSFPSVHWELAYFLFGMFFMYLGPFVVILVLYCGIVLELVHRHRECSTQLQQQRNGVSDGLRRSGIGNLGKAKEKALKMTLIIAAIFFICWTPYYVVCLWYWIDKASFSKLDPRIQKALFLFACTNSTANPVVYGIYHLRKSGQSTRMNTFYATSEGNVDTVISLGRTSSSEHSFRRRTSKSVTKFSSIYTDNARGFSGSDILRVTTNYRAVQPNPAQPPPSTTISFV